MVDQINKDKKKILIVGLVCFVLIISILGSTYAFLFLDNKTSTIVGAEAECYTVNYTNGLDIKTNITSGIDYTSGESTDIVMYAEPGCASMFGTLYLTTNDTSTIDFEAGALKYSVVVNDEVVSEGVINGEKNQEIYTYFNLNDERTTYQVYIWLDEEKYQDVQVGDKFSGFVHADAILSSYVTRYVMKGSGEVTSGEDRFLGIEDIPRNKIESMEFVKIIKDEIPENSIGEYDVSIAQDNSVLLYYTDTDNNDLYEVKIGTEIGRTIASDGAYLFSYLTNMTSIDLKRLDTSRVANMSFMFAYSSMLEEINLDSFKTSNVTSMMGMFAGGIRSEDGYKIPMMINKIDGIEKFDTSNVKDMSRMFYYCSYLENLNLSNFDTSNVRDMSYMFSAVNYVDFNLSNFDTSKVTNMSHMFFDVNTLDTDLSSLETSSVTDMSYMFGLIMYINNFDLSNFDTSKVINMSGMFYRNLENTSFDLSSFDTSNVTSMFGMFRDCQRLSKIYVGPGFKTDSLESSIDMFLDSKYLRGGKNTKYDPEHTDGSYAKIDGGTSNPGYFTDISELQSTS